MNRKKVQILIVLVCCTLSVFPLLGETIVSSTSYTDLANYRTAIRCYQQARNYIEKAEWKNAFSQADLGLVYDNSISDLWFVRAYAGQRLGKTPAELLPLLKTALEKEKWVDYSKDGALLFYAELLSLTGQSQRALEYVEGGKIFPSSSREYIKILCYYRIGTPEAYKRARELVSEASRLYPEDMRFPQVFYTYELRSDLTYEKEAEALGRIFSRRFVEMKDFPPELYLSAAVFAEPSVKTRVLKAFDASGKRHPMYAILALEEKLISETQAYEYFCSFANTSIKLSELEYFTSILTEEHTKSALSAFLNGFRGTISHDVTGDCIPDLFIEYSRGRPKRIRFDQNQDGVDDWIARCDFGVPTELLLAEAETRIFYNKYPFISSMELYSMTFKFVESALEWTPVAIVAYEPLADALDGLQFFVPQVKKKPDSFLPAMRDIIHSAYSVTYPVEERESTRIEISILDGFVHSAQYYEGNTLYAQLACENGIPKTRNVDLDGDGWFELTQNFGFSPRSYLDYVSPQESVELYESIFGLFFFPQGIYIQQVLLDRNLDMKIDFGQEYISGRGVVSTWGDPMSDNWVVQYLQSEETTNSRALFKLPHSDDLVSVYLENKIPVRVTMESSEGLSYRDLEIVPVDGVYWLGDAGNSEMSAHLKECLGKINEQGNSMVIQMDEKTTGSSFSARFSAVRISDFYFGVLLDE